jgi:polyhydroxyalkanoate synthesis regulator phasin
MPMSEKTEKTERPEVDPFAPWVQFMDNWVKSWSGVMSETVASEGFVASMGEQLEGWLEATKLVRQQMKVSMEQYLQQMSLPTRSQVVSLAQRLTQVEMRLDDLEAKADEGLDRLKAIQQALTTEE